MLKKVLILRYKLDNPNFSNNLKVPFLQTWKTSNKFLLFLWAHTNSNSSDSVNKYIIVV
ncbi:MAG: hypothetical protein ACI9A7_001158 [Cyclobacteriaceae bacterium]|jgi:hypothetical protein